MAQRDLDFDEEARKIFANLNLPPDGGAATPLRAGSSRYRDADAVWQHPRGGGRVYIGNLSIAQNKAGLQQLGITHVVNCQGPESSNYFEDDGDITYLRFPIAFWRVRLGPSPPPETTKKFLTRYLAFVYGAVARGDSVLIHCLAGAHRAGTAGVIFVMAATKLPSLDALLAVQRCRPIVNPIGGFPHLLGLVDKARHLLDLDALTTSTADTSAAAAAATAAAAEHKSSPAASSAGAKKPSLRESSTL
eukprot:m.15770 g.15770  ORF g.15770 m.15770 type:complete len:248 (+) comp3459_c0_seq1:826-1569(+)